MGFGDFLRDCADIVKDIVCLSAQVEKAAAECVQDIREAVTQDVKINYPENQKGKSIPRTR